MRVIMYAAAVVALAGCGDSSGPELLDLAGCYELHTVSNQPVPAIITSTIVPSTHPSLVVVEAEEVAAGEMVIRRDNSYRMRVRHLHSTTATLTHPDGRLEVQRHIRAGTWESAGSILVTAGKLDFVRHSGWVLDNGSASGAAVTVHLTDLALRFVVTVNDTGLCTG
jgi:hypothetical protein